MAPIGRNIQSDHPELWSGKHRTTGLNVQVACTLSGHLAWVSDPAPGKTHDAKAVRESGLLHEEAHPRHLGDKGYIGLGMLTPIRKPAGGQLLDWQKQFNTDVNSIRYRMNAPSPTSRPGESSTRRPRKVPGSSVLPVRVAHRHSALKQPAVHSPRIDVHPLADAGE